MGDALIPGMDVELEGANGARWVETVPEPGPRLTALEGLISAGHAAVVDGPDLPADEGELENDYPEDPPKGTVDDVVAWVRQAPEDGEPSDGWPARARAALDAELAKGDKARSTLVDALTEALGE